jgi:uncharacterized protein YjbI with pentapeptide repeats
MMSSWSKRNNAWRLLVAAAVAVAALTVVVGLIWPITDLIAAHDVGAVTGPLGAQHLQAAREAVRTQLLTLGAGVFAAGALIFTARNFTLSRRTYDLAEQGQVTDRYTKAIEQVGSGQLDVRIGGIYALERIARDSARDHPAVMEVLAAFVRDHSREQSPLPEPGAGSPERETRPDVQAAITVIGRRDVAYDLRVINLASVALTGADFHRSNLWAVDLRRAVLARADLRGLNLSHANFDGANVDGALFDYANLDGARLFGVNLSGGQLNFASLRGAHLNLAPLVGASLYHADLATASLRSAKLHDANLGGANLSGADLNSANLSNASLSGADLRGVNLGGADLSGANLDGALLENAELSDAICPRTQEPPAGWFRDAASCRLKRAS